MRSGWLTRWRRIVATMGGLAMIVATVALTGRAATAAEGGTPFGFLDQVVSSPAGVVVAGWAIDPDTSAAVDVHLYRNGEFLGAYKADGNRPDVAAVYPASGARHGYAQTFPTAEGRHTFCAYAINVGGGDPYRLLGCTSITVNHAPTGWLDVVQRVPGTDRINITGWALDPDSTEPVTVHVYVDDVFAGAQVAAGYRPDVAALYWWSSGRTAFDLDIAGSEGRRQVCAYALGVGPGAPWSRLGCKTITFTSAPIGSFEGARVGDGALRVSGWALDPDVTAAVDVHFYIDGYFSASIPANTYREDVAVANPAYGGAHGFHADLWLWPGATTVCAYALNLATGPGYSELGCKALDPMAPAGSGTGRRVVYANLSQRLWLIGDDGFVDRSYAISGKYLDPPPGTYGVYAFQRYADAGHDGITMEYFVAFNPSGLGYGFHTIPTYADGTPLQSESELGFFRSAGCVRQKVADAIYMWNWARIGDPVVVLAS